MSHRVAMPLHEDPEASSLPAPYDFAEETQRLLKRRIAFLLNLPENKYCTDCCRPAPRWVSLVVVDPELLRNDEGILRGKAGFIKRTISNISVSSRKPSTLQEPILPLGCFCCLECSGAHRRLGTHVTFVRSVDFDSFKEHEVQALEFAGNATVNGILEANLLRTSQDYDTGAIKVTFRVHDREIIKRCGGNTAWNNNTCEDNISREAFIRDKYEKKVFIDVKALRRIYRYPTYTKSGMGCIVYGGPESPQPSTASDTESACEASIPSASSDSPFQMFTTDPKTVETINKYLHDHSITPSSNGSAKQSRKIQSKRKPPRQKNSDHHTTSSSSISEDLILDLRNLQIDAKTPDVLSPQSSLSRSPLYKSPYSRKGHREQHSSSQSITHISEKNANANNPSPLLDSSMIVSIDYEETSAYEVVFQRDDEVALGREDVLNNYGRTKVQKENGPKANDTSSLVRKSEIKSTPPRLEQSTDNQKIRNNSRVRSKKEDSSAVSIRVKDEKGEKLDQGSSKMRGRKDKDVNTKDQSGIRPSRPFSLFKSSSNYDSL